MKYGLNLPNSRQNSPYSTATLLFALGLAGVELLLFGLAGGVRLAVAARPPVACLRVRGRRCARLAGLGVAQFLNALGNLLGAKADLGHGVLDGQAAHDVAVMHLLVAREVLGDGLRRNVLQHHAPARELARFGADAAQVAAKDGMAALQVRRPILEEFENVGGSTKIRSQRLRVWRWSRIQASTSSRTK